MKLIMNLSDWYFSNKTLPHWIVLILDTGIVTFSYLLSEIFELRGMIATNSISS